jgi:hypothetical protein
MRLCLQAINFITELETPAQATNSRQQRKTIMESCRPMELQRALALLQDLCTYQQQAWQAGDANDGTGEFQLEHCTIAVTDTCIEVSVVCEALQSSSTPSP